MHHVIHSTSLIDREWLMEKLGKKTDTPKVAPRGDHDLNPGSHRKKILTNAALLVPLIILTNKIEILLTRRTNNLAKHAGQISFPGGHVDKIDRTPEETALRETEEETGLKRKHIDIVGRLDDYETRTGFRVTPIVATVTPPFNLSPEPGEVAEIIKLPLDFLLNPVNHRRHNTFFEGSRREFYAMNFKDHFIWGATAGMLINLYEALES